MKKLFVSVKYGGREFEAQVSPPATANEYLQTISYLMLAVNEVFEVWARDARLEHWNEMQERRSTHEEF